MAEEKVETIAADEPEVEEGSLETGWEFFEPPTVEAVRAKLETLPPVYGLKTADFWEFVQPLSQSKNISQEKGQKEYRTVWNLYVTVAGRIAMVTQAAMKHDWKVDFVPEQRVPEGNPAGYVVMNDDRIVYREFVVIEQRVQPNQVATLGQSMMPLGRKPGTAWVPSSGGAGAVQSNRWEKVETAARGRALAAWGFGVLPGSGVASLEEMLGMDENRAAERPGNGRRRQQAEKPNREDVERNLLGLLAQYVDVTGLSQGSVEEKVIDFAARTFRQTLGYSEAGPLDFAPLKDGELVLLKNRIEKEVQTAQAEGMQL